LNLYSGSPPVDSLKPNLFVNFVKKRFENKQIESEEREEALSSNL
jgi:hypothetical protein